MLKKYTYLRKKQAKNAVSTLVILSMFLLSITPLTSASSWDPTLLVNTEAFQTIDDKDTSADLKLTFGDTINKSLIYQRTAGRFKFDDDLYISGDLGVTRTMSGRYLKLHSGALIESYNSFETGSLIVYQRVTGTGVHIQNFSTGAPLVALDNYAGPSAASGSVHILFGYRGAFDVAMYRRSSGSLTIASSTGNTLVVDSEMSGNTDVFKVLSDHGSNENTVMRVEADGSVFADGTFSGGGADYAEYFASMEQDMPYGTIVSLDTSRAFHIRSAQDHTDTMIGIVSTNPAFAAQHKRLEEFTESTRVLVGLVGQIPTRVVTENGPIRIGDPITISSRPGVGRRARDKEVSIGFALESYNGQDEGLITVYVGPRSAPRETPHTIRKELNTLQEELHYLRDTIQSLYQNLHQPLHFGSRIIDTLRME